MEIEKSLKYETVAEVIKIGQEALKVVTQENMEFALGLATMLLQQYQNVSLSDTQKIKRLGKLAFSLLICYEQCDVKNENARV